MKVHIDLQANHLLYMPKTYFYKYFTSVTIGAIVPQVIIAIPTAIFVMLNKATIAHLFSYSYILTCKNIK